MVISHFGCQSCKSLPFSNRNTVFPTLRVSKLPIVFPKKPLLGPEKAHFWAKNVHRVGNPEKRSL